MELEEADTQLTFELPTPQSPNHVNPHFIQDEDDLVKNIFDQGDTNDLDDSTGCYKQKHRHLGKRRLKKRRRVGGALWRSDETEKPALLQNGPYSMCNGFIHDEEPSDLKRPLSPSTTELVAQDLTGPEPVVKKQKLHTNNSKLAGEQEQHIKENGVTHGDVIIPNGVASHQSAERAEKPTFTQTPKPFRVGDLWESLCELQTSLANHAGPFNPFIPKTRALDMMNTLQPTFRIHLFPDGYARDVPKSGSLLNNNATNYAPQPLSDLSKKATSSPRTPKTNVLTSSSPAALPRYPYDRTSRYFLKALELGVIPPREELPELSQCRFYNGCLIAEVFDYREGVFGPGTKVLLKPDYCSFVSDMNVLTDGLDLETALKVEEGVLLELSRYNDFGPDVVLPTGYKTGRISSPVSPVNLLYLPRPHPAPAYARSPALDKSTAALMLIAGADKYKEIVRNRNEAVRVLKGLSEQGRKDVTNTAPLSLPSVPPREALTALPGNDGNRRPSKGHQKIRNVALIHSGRRARARLEEAKARAQQTGNNEILKKAIGELTTMTAKAKSPVYFVQLIEKAGQGCECVIARGVHGEKARDVLKVSCGNKQEANQFVDQFQVLTGEEGYASLDNKSADRSRFQGQGNASGAAAAASVIQARGRNGNAVQPNLAANLQTQLVNGVPAASSSAALTRIQPGNFQQAQAHRQLQNLQAHQVVQAQQGVQAQQAAQAQQSGARSAGVVPTGGLPGALNPQLLGGGLHAAGANQMGVFDPQNLGQVQANVQGVLPPKLVQHHQQVARFNQQKEIQQGKSMNKG